jgi:hypothetical protein
VKGGCGDGVWEVGMLANSFSTYERTVGQLKQTMNAMAVQMHNGLASEDGSSSKCCSLLSMVFDSIFGFFLLLSSFYYFCQFFILGF